MSNSDRAYEVAKLQILEMELEAAKRSCDDGKEPLSLEECAKLRNEIAALIMPPLSKD